MKRVFLHTYVPNSPPYGRAIVGEVTNSKDALAVAEAALHALRADRITLTLIDGRDLFEWHFVAPVRRLA